MMQGPAGLRPLSFDGGRTSPPLLTSAQAGWAGVPFELHRTAPSEVERSGGPPAGEQSLLLVMAGGMNVVLKRDGRETLHRCVPGSLSLHTSEEHPRLRRVEGSGDMLVVRLSRAWQERIGPTGFSSALRFQPPGAANPTLRGLAAMMCEEIQRGAPHGRIFAESLSLAFLSAAANALPAGPMRVRGNLSPDQRARLQRHIEDHLHDDLSVADLAALCGVQARQLGNLFRRAFGVSPYRYVIDRRIARGTQELARRRGAVDEIALQVGFSSGSHFASEFRRAHGMSPRDFVRSLRSVSGS